MPDQPTRPDGETREYTVLTDAADVRVWATEHGVVPVSNTGVWGSDRPELVRRNDVHPQQEPQDWERFSEQFETKGFVFVHGPSDETFRLVDRDEVDGRGVINASMAAELLGNDGTPAEATEHETESSATTETEGPTLESELVRSEVVERDRLETEVVSKELVGVAVTERPGTDAAADRQRSDAARADDGERTYLGDDQGHRIRLEAGGVIGLDIDETRLETEEWVEEHVVESRPVERDVDAGVIYDHIERSGVFDSRPGQPVKGRHVETAFDEDDLATSTVIEHRTVENEVVERKAVYAEVTDVDVDRTEIVSRELLESTFLDPELGAEDGTIADPEAERSSGDVTGNAAVVEPAMGDDQDEITARLLGRDVELPTGETIGIVADIEEDQETVHVEEDPGLTDRIKASLNWGDGGDGPTLTGEEIREVRYDAVVVDRVEDSS